MIYYILSYKSGDKQVLQVNFVILSLIFPQNLNFKQSFHVYRTDYVQGEIFWLSL